MQQTATSEMLRLISNSPIQSVLDAVAEHASRLCDAGNARIWRLEDNVLRLAASYGESSVTMDGREGLPADRDTVTGRAACDRRAIHVHDIAAEVSEYPVGGRIVKDEGWRTTLATPLLREVPPLEQFWYGEWRSGRSPTNRSRFSSPSPARRRSRSKTRACSKPRTKQIRYSIQHPVERVT
jgi:hypothetical protein